MTTITIDCAVLKQAVWASLPTSIKNWVKDNATGAA